MKRQKYQISPEETVLEYQALEKEQRRLRQADRKETNTREGSSPAVERDAHLGGN